MKKFNTLSRGSSRFHFLQLALSLLIVLLISCSKDNFLSLPTASETDFSIEEAQTWYKAQVKSEMNMFTKFQPEWDKAKFTKSSTAENFLIIPFKQALNFNVQQGSIRQSQQLQLRIFRDELNKLQGRIVEITSEQPDGNLNDYTLADSFSGRVFFRSINDGKLLFGYRYEKGNVTFKITPSNPNARLRDEVCECKVQYYFTCNCQKPGTTWGESDVIVDGTLYTVGCNDPAPSSNDLPTPTPVQMGFRCGG